MIDKALFSALTSESASTKKVKSSLYFYNSSIGTTQNITTDNDEHCSKHQVKLIKSITTAPKIGWIEG
jgi:hypothetical protein